MKRRRLLEGNVSMGTIFVCLFFKTFYFEIIIDSHAIVRKNTKRSVGVPR